MINAQAIARINELAKKAKTVGLTDEEIEERNLLRSQYLKAIRASLQTQLDSIEFVDEDKPNNGKLKH